jgi:hypothetical protein
MLAEAILQAAACNYEVSIKRRWKQPVLEITVISRRGTYVQVGRSVERKTGGPLNEFEIALAEAIDECARDIRGSRRIDSKDL